MGVFVYDRTVELELDDRTLAHLQIVIINKLRRSESFAFSWKTPAQAGDGRSSVWLHPSANLLFRYVGSRPPRINPYWIQALTDSANQGPGLQVAPEPPQPS
ncbi:ATP-dependent DNA ligase [Frigoribacterium endophyticum]|uniref:DUF7882 family protein n=1 Tax=Frigoribacterium endophyticum TaxID=1522176 RepID=UPI0014217516|nr:ATP-dependent DNA ligase [Frigoribacterium endophyticum]NII52121.1 hypothetical protein [Frigoribacterium endophyticum]